MKNLVRKTSLKERRLATEIVDMLNRNNSVTMTVGSRSARLTAGLVKFLNQIFVMMKDGKSLVVLASEMEVSTEEAAQLLNLSRPYVVKLLEEGKMPFRKVGKHRRILLADVLFYKKQFEKRQDKALAFLVQQAQDLKLGYQ